MKAFYNENTSASTCGNIFLKTVALKLIHFEGGDIFLTVVEQI